MPSLLKPPAHIKDAGDRMRCMMEMVQASAAARSSFDDRILTNPKLVNWSTEEHWAEFEMDVTPAMCNHFETLHGGAIATIFDNLTSLTTFTMPDSPAAQGLHVTRTLTCTYFYPVSAGTKIRIYCQINSSGRQTVNMRGELRNQDGKLCASCVHDKAVVPARGPKL